MMFCESFDYHDGSLVRKLRTSNRIKVGSTAGTKRPDGYLQVRHCGKLYLVHRIIWEMHHGEIADGDEIDHINHNKLDNRIENLRLVTRNENQMNRPMQYNNTSGVNGVDWNARNGKWRARIRVFGKEIHLGYFNNINDAKKAKHLADVKYGFHDNHGIKNAY